MGISGTSGVLNGLGKSGLVRRKTTIPTQTIRNAINGPIETSSPKTPSGKSPATTAATKPFNNDATWGVLN